MSKYKVYYYKFPLPRVGYGNFRIEDLQKFHTFVREIEASSKDDVFRQMQGFNWSPRGEARPLIERLGLNHTSMSVGDILQDSDGVYWECASLGWEKIE